MYEAGIKKWIEIEAEIVILHQAKAVLFWGVRHQHFFHELASQIKDQNWMDISCF